MSAALREVEDGSSAMRLLAGRVSISYPDAYRRTSQGWELRLFHPCLGCTEKRGHAASHVPMRRHAINLFQTPRDELP